MTSHRVSPISDYDRQVLRAVGDGAGTWMVAARMHVPTSDIRRRLIRMEHQGLVSRSPRSSINNIIWLVTPPTPEVSHVG